jgi:O-antigen/teichoic acid export membrane protein
MCSPRLEPDARCGRGESHVCTDLVVCSLRNATGRIAHLIRPENHLLFRDLNSEVRPTARLARASDPSTPETPTAPELAIALSEYGQFWRVLDPLEIKPHHLAFVVSLATKCLGLFNNWLVIRLAMPSIGPREFGVFAAIIALTSVLTMFDLGVGTSLVNTAAAVKAASTAGTRGALRDALGSTLAYCIGATLVLPLGVWVVLRFASNPAWFLHVPAVSSGTIAVCAVYAAVFLTSNAIQKLFAGLQLIWLGYGLALVGAVLTTVVLIGIARASVVSVPALLLAVLLPSPLLLLGGLATWLATNADLRPRMRIGGNLRPAFKLPEGFSIYVCQTGSILVYSAPVWVAASLSGSENAGVVFALTRLVAPWVLIVALYTQPLWPEYTRLLAMNDGARVRRMVQQSVAVTIAVGVVGLLVTFAFGSTILALLHVAATPTQLLAALGWTLLIAGRQCLMAPVFASGRVRVPAIAFTVVVATICLVAFVGPTTSAERLFGGFATVELLLLAAHYVAYRAVRPFDPVR